MKACGAGGRGLGGGRPGAGALPPSSEPEREPVQAKGRASTPSPGAPCSKERASVGHVQTPSLAGSPRPLQILSPQPGPAAPGNRTLRTPSSWALRTDASPQRVSGCSDHWGLEDTRVLGSTTAARPQLSSRRSRRSAWNTPEQTSGTHQQGDGCPALTPQRADTAVLSWFPSALPALWDPS